MMNDEKKIELHIITVLLAFCVLAFGLLSLFNNYPKYDEVHFHLPTLKLFVLQNPYSAAVDTAYNAANTPLPYIIGALPAKLTGAAVTLQYARMLNIICGIFTLLLLWVISSKYLQSWSRVYFCGIVFFSPYFLLPMYTYFMSIYGLCFFLLAMQCSTLKGNYRWFMVGASLACAILAQQFYILVLPAFTFTIITENPTQSPKERLWWLFTLFSPLMVTLPLFLSWHGLTPMKFSSHSFRIIPVYFTAMLTITGFCIIPWFFIKSITQYKRFILPAMLCAACLIWLFPPAWNNNPAPGEVSGLIHHTLQGIKNHNLYIAILIQWVGTAAGLIFVISIIFDKPKENSLITNLILIMFLGFIGNQAFSERHLLPFYTILYLYLFILLEKKGLAGYTKGIGRAWFSAQVCLGSLYLYYWLYVQRHV
ncbi:MAG: hypothetical protein LWX56_03550 [Ignavibacteria bacterium]|nr:hypothetical protein [Ignavibacteria bacterium]